MFVRDTPINWDAVQFELALSHFDLSAHQPHPPGYILYVLLGRALNLLVGNPGLALSLLSVLCSALAVPLIYWLTLRVFADRGIALGAALLLLASPLALYYGSVGLTYAPEMLLSIIVAGLAWRVRCTRDVRGVAMLGVALGAAGGIRQTSLLVLLPLCAWAVWGGSRRSWAWFGSSLAATCILWLVPLLAMSGGPAAYLHENALLAQAVSARTSILEAGAAGLGYNVTLEVLALGLGLAFGAVPTGLWALRVVNFSLAHEVKGFMLWWALPSPAMYAASHVGQHGYLLVALPPFLILSALCARVLAERWARGRRRTAALSGVLVCALLSLGSIAYFVLAQGPTTAVNIAQNDAHWKAVRAALASMDPASTALVMSTGWDKPFRAAGYLLPEFHSYAAGKDDEDRFGWLYSAYGGHSTYSLPQPQAGSYLTLPAGTRTVIALDEGIAERFGYKEMLRCVSLADGSVVYILQSNGANITGLALRGNRLQTIRGQGSEVGDRGSVVLRP